MATQEEWREIAYQRSLGENGSGTGSIVNQRALDEYLRNKNSNAGIPFTAHHDSITFPVVSPRISGGDKKAMGSALLVSLIFAAVAYFSGQALTATIITFGVSFLVLKLLRLFFSSDLGFLILSLVNMALQLSLFCLFLFGVWHLVSPQLSLWIAAGVIGIVGIKIGSIIISSKYYKFKQTPAGARFDRVVTRLVRFTVLGFLAICGVWFMNSFQ